MTIGLRKNIDWPVNTPMKSIKTGIKKDKYVKSI